MSRWMRLIGWWSAKVLQALGLIVVAGGFLIRFPELMSPRLLFVGIGLFGAGYFLERLFG